MNAIIKSKTFFGVLAGLSMIRFIQFAYYKSTNFGNFAPAWHLEELNNTFGLPSGMSQNIISLILFTSTGIAFAGISDKLRDVASTRILFSLIILNSLIIFLYILEILTPAIDYNVAILSPLAFLFPLWLWILTSFYGEASVFFLLLMTVFQILLLSGIVTTLFGSKTNKNNLQSINMQASISELPLTGGVAKMKSNSSQWTVRIPGQPENPIDTATLQNWAKSGFIKADTMVTEVATGYFYQARQIPGVFSAKSYVTALLLSFFFGVFGVDRFYLGHVGVGLGKLFTFGGLGIWALIDFILIATKNVKDSQGVPLA